MLDKLKKAHAAVAAQQVTCTFDELCDAAPAGKLLEWEDLVKGWQADHSVKPNPYQETWESDWPYFGLTTSIFANYRI